MGHAALYNIRREPAATGITFFSKSLVRSGSGGYRERTVNRHWIAILESRVVAVMAPASFAGGFAGAALARRVPAAPLRIIIVVLGLAVAVRLIV